LFVALYALVPCSRVPLCFCQIIHLEMSKPTAFGLFQLVWHFLKGFGIFCSLGPGNRAGLKGRGPGAIFNRGPLWRIPWRHCLQNLSFRWFAKFSFAFSSSRLCACWIYSIVSRLSL